MPATELSFTADLPPTAIYLDTDFIISVLFATEPHHERCQALVLRLFEFGTGLSLSSLGWMEFAYVIARQDFRDRLPQDVIERFGLRQWQRERARQAYLDAHLTLLQQFLDQFPWVEIPLTSDVRHTALDIVKEFNLDAHDAVHLASATLTGALNFASLDRAYRRVDGLSLWNDHIFAMRRNAGT